MAANVSLLEASLALSIEIPSSDHDMPTYDTKPRTVYGHPYLVNARCAIPES